MKTILCPTDFSLASENAIHYAFELNANLQAKIILMFSYYVPIPPPEVPAYIPDPAVMRKEAMSKLKELKAEMIKSHPKMKFEIELVATEGNPVTEIKAIQEKQNIDMIVTGTKGAHGLKKVLIGTNSARIILNSDCPVITVPEGTTYHPFKKIIFATNYAEGDFENIEKVIDLAKPFNAEVILLHIASGDRNKSSEFNSIEHFKERVKEDSGYPNITFNLIEGKDVEDRILNFINEEEADLIAMTNRHRTFFSKIFERSLTKQIAFETHTPLLAFHAEKEEVYFF